MLECMTSKMKNMTKAGGDFTKARLSLSRPLYKESRPFIHDVNWPWAIIQCAPALPSHLVSFIVIIITITITIIIIIIIIIKWEEKRKNNSKLPCSAVQCSELWFEKMIKRPTGKRLKCLRERRASIRRKVEISLKHFPQFSMDGFLKASLFLRTVLLEFPFFKSFISRLFFVTACLERSCRSDLRSRWHRIAQPESPTSQWRMWWWCLHILVLFLRNGH